MQDIVDYMAFLELRKNNFDLGYDPTLSPEEQKKVDEQKKLEGMKAIWGDPKKLKPKKKKRRRK